MVVLENRTNLTIGPTSASFKSCGKHPFSNDKLMNFVISRRCISGVILTMSAGMSPTGVALEPSILKITCRTCSSVTCWKENFLSHIARAFFHEMPRRQKADIDSKK